MLKFEESFLNILGDIKLKPSDCEAYTHDANIIIKHVLDEMKLKCPDFKKAVKATKLAGE